MLQCTLQFKPCCTAVRCKIFQTAAHTAVQISKFSFYIRLACFTAKYSIFLIIFICIRLENLTEVKMEALSHSLIYYIHCRILQKPTLFPGPNGSLNVGMKVVGGECVSSINLPTPSTGMIAG